MGALVLFVGFVSDDLLFRHLAPEKGKYHREG
jgi:hypothetical protein